MAGFCEPGGAGTIMIALGVVKAAAYADLITNGGLWRDCGALGAVRFHR